MSLFRHRPAGLSARALKSRRLALCCPFSWLTLRKKCFVSSGCTHFPPGWSDTIFDLRVHRGHQGPAASPPLTGACPTAATRVFVPELKGDSRALPLGLLQVLVGAPRVKRATPMVISHFPAWSLCGHEAPLRVCDIPTLGFWMLLLLLLLV